jgi:hypothetical protein
MNNKYKIGNHIRGKLLDNLYYDFFVVSIQELFETSKKKEMQISYLYGLIPDDSPKAELIYSTETEINDCIDEDATHAMQSITEDKLFPILKRLKIKYNQYETEVSKLERTKMMIRLELQNVSKKQLTLDTEINPIIAFQKRCNLGNFNNIFKDIWNIKLLALREKYIEEGTQYIIHRYLNEFLKEEVRVMYNYIVPSFDQYDKGFYCSMTMYSTESEDKENLETRWVTAKLENISLNKFIEMFYFNLINDRKIFKHYCKPIIL